MDPLHDRLLVRPIEQELERKVIIPDTAKEKPQEKLGVGVKVGDKTFSWKYSRLG